MNKTVVFTQEEANLLVQLIDAAVKACGLQVANVAHVLATKIQSTPVDDTPKAP